MAPSSQPEEQETSRSCEERRLDVVSSILFLPTAMGVPVGEGQQGTCDSAILHFCKNVLVATPCYPQEPALKASLSRNSVFVFSTGNKATSFGLFGPIWLNFMCRGFHCCVLTQCAARQAVAQPAKLEEKELPAPQKDAIGSSVRTLEEACLQYCTYNNAHFFTSLQ